MSDLIRARARYNGLELTLDKRLSGGTQFSLGYTWSQSIDDATELFGSEGGIVQDIRIWAAIAVTRASTGVTG